MQTPDIGPVTASARLATSIKQGTVTASLMLRKLGSYLSPLSWEHINLTGDYLWHSSAKIGVGKLRPLRPLQPA